ncbi:MAG: TraR/DksA C4-type zinc finger protein [bacterium]
MNKKILKEAKQKLGEEKIVLEKELEKFAQKDGKLKGDWDTRFPKFGGEESGGGQLEKAADEVEEYGNLLPVEHSMEIRLKNIDEALKKFADGSYGKCEKCGREISQDRLEVSPEAKNCRKCA